MNGNKLPWWLEAGAESCSFCESPLHYEAMVFCVDCDRPVCPACLVERDRSALCPECHDERGPQ